MRDIRDEIPSLQGRCAFTRLFLSFPSVSYYSVASVNRHTKEMAESEQKGATEFQKQSQTDSLHPQLAQIYGIWADKLTNNASHRSGLSLEVFNSL